MRVIKLGSGTYPIVLEGVLKRLIQQFGADNVLRVLTRLTNTRVEE